MLLENAKTFEQIISNSQQKYVVLKAMRRSGGISKKIITEKLEVKSVCFISNRSLVDDINQSINLVI